MHEKCYFSLQLLKSGFVANVKWQEEPGFGMLHHIWSLQNFTAVYRTNFLLQIIEITQFMFLELTELLKYFSTQVTWPLLSMVFDSLVFTEGIVIQCLKRTILLHTRYQSSTTTVHFVFLKLMFQ